ncbi:lipid II:glycine glycyltransferase FemX [Flavobacterium sp.]|uniref:lipid II:glycine glycyltransferase FemX n=1 Tax=Flavobacterium sp. TaxID=239 RepID=UPI003BE76406
MIKSFFTKDQSWLDKWDNYLQETERGLYNQLSFWIKAYDIYGFNHDFYIITDNDEIIGGCGIVIARFSIFKFLIVPCGPVLDKNQEHLIDSILKDLKEFAIQKNCCFFQINLPITKEGVGFHDYTLDKISSNSIFYSGLEGMKFKYVIPLFGMRLVDLSDKTFDEVVQGFGSNHKRNLKKASSFNFQFHQVTTKEAIAEAYNCFVQNAREKGYPLRSYNSIKYTLQNYVANDQAIIATCFYQNKVVGAIYVMICGKRLIYINGGIIKEYQNLPISVYMHTELIKYSIEKGYKSYDLSVGGSEGVIRFKEGFGSKLFNFENSRYWVFKPFYFKIYTFLENRIKPHKQSIASLLFIFKKILYRN